MKTVSMVELRTDSERVVQGLKRGERMLLSYRGKPLAELVPTRSDVEKLSPLQALKRAEEASRQNPRYLKQAKQFLKGLRRDEIAWGERTA